MDANTWQRAKDLIARALDRPASERAAFVDHECPDADVRAEILDLLALHETFSDTLAEPGSATGAPDRSVLTHARIGSQVSHYRVDRWLGAGGMGEVYLAYDAELDRQVAIKFLFPTAAADDHARRRLVREARAAAALDHPSICAVYEVGSDPASGDFVVMQYVEGETLAARLRRGPLDPVETLRLAGHLAEALVVAHRCSVVHRDLKPQNIILTPSGRPKLLDFGVAKYVEPASPEAVTVSGLTLRGALVGTPGYMAPEQIRGVAIDGRADLFALGCVIYECATARRPFAARTTAEVLANTLHVTPPAISATVPVSPAFDALCARLLEKDRHDRMASAEQALGAIRTLLPVSTGGTSPAGPMPDPIVRPRRFPVSWVVVAAAVVIGIGGGWLILDGPTREHVPTPEAQHWYEQGVEKIREGSYAGARSALQEAVRLDPKFAIAYARLADADSELDDEAAAKDALARVFDLVPDQSRLGTESRLRVHSVTAMVARDSDAAIEACRQLAERAPRDAAGWLDLGRAQENAFRLGDARVNYEKAVQLDPEYAAGHLRLGALQGVDTATALANLDEAGRLYHAATNPEGEMEALLRKGFVLEFAAGDHPKARDAFERVIAGTSDDLYVGQRVRAQFALAGLLAEEGKFAVAQSTGETAVDAASRAGLSGFAANGETDLGSVLMLMGHDADADALFVRAESTAARLGATRTQMRATLQQAALKEEEDLHKEAIDLATPARAFFKAGHYARFEANAENVLSQARDSLQQYDEAIALAKDAHASAISIEDRVDDAAALDNLSYAAAALGGLPMALDYRRQSNAIDRSPKDLRLLPYGLTDEAELLIRLGRGDEAERLLQEVEVGIAQKLIYYEARASRIAMLRAMRAAIDGDDADVERQASAALDPREQTPTDTASLARVLREYVLARHGRSRVAADVIAGWAAGPDASLLARELSYWVAQTLIARHDTARAAAVAYAAWSSPAARPNAELEWRLAATIVQSGAHPAAAGQTDFASQARDELNQVKNAWPVDDVNRYLARPDLVALVRISTNTVH